MKIVDYSDFNPQNSYWIIDRVDVLPPCAEDLISLADDSLDVNSIIDSLNSINEQGITKLDLVYRTYTWRGRVLSINSMGSGEKIFLIANLAAQLEIPIWFGNCIKTLSVSSMKKMFK